MYLYRYQSSMSGWFLKWRKGQEEDNYTWRYGCVCWYIVYIICGSPELKSKAGSRYRWVTLWWPTSRIRSAPTNRDCNRSNLPRDPMRWFIWDRLFSITFRDGYFRYLTGQYLLRMVCRIVFKSEQTFRPQASKKYNSRCIPHIFGGVNIHLPAIFRCSPG